MFFLFPGPVGKALFPDDSEIMFYIRMEFFQFSKKPACPEIGAFPASFIIPVYCAFSDPALRITSAPSARIACFERSYGIKYPGEGLIILEDRL